MDFKTFFIKKIMMSFFISVTCICAAMALIGMVFEPGAKFGYDAYFSPLLFGALASLPSLVTYSKNELSLRQAAIRNVIHFVLLEVVILVALYYGGVLTSASMAVSLGVSIFIIDLIVNLVLWTNDKRTAEEFSGALRKLQDDACSLD